MININRASQSFKSVVFPLVLLITGIIFSASKLQAQDYSSMKPEELPTEQGIVDQGRQLFTDNCTQCHAFDSRIVGPPLQDAYKNWPTVAGLTEYIKYPKKVIDSGHERAVKLYEEYQTLMPNHDFMSDDQVRSLISYIVAESKNPTPKPEPATASADAGSMQPIVVKTGESKYLTWMIVILLGLFLAILFVLVLIVMVLIRYLRAQRGATGEELDIQLVDWSKLKSAAFSKPLLGAAVFVLLALVGKGAFDTVYGVGIQMGYAPTQPVAFSHKLHAGMYEIDCGYCHTGAYLNKNATIPSVNICMNCHNQVKTNSPEIKKLYNAIEKDQPIEWVRVHNLPDLAYFNHSQHTIVAGLECEQCHGPVEEMEVITQYAPLTMGWCINCHRETVVKAEGNAYYDRLIEFHENKDKIVVEDIGGLECSRCHY